MQKKKPAKYQQFMDNRAWFYDISRRFDGSMGIVGGGRYDNPAGWGLGLALAYTVPRQKLRIYGAPKTKFCKSYQLPKRPWGPCSSAQERVVLRAIRRNGDVNTQRPSRPRGSRPSDGASARSARGCSPCGGFRSPPAAWRS